MERLVVKAIDDWRLAPEEFKSGRVDVVFPKGKASLGDGAHSCELICADRVVGGIAEIINPPPVSSHATLNGKPFYFYPNKGWRQVIAQLSEHFDIEPA